MTPSLTDPPTPQRFFSRPASSLRPSSSRGTSATVVTALPRRPLVSRRTFPRSPRGAPPRPRRPRAAPSGPGRAPCGGRRRRWTRRPWCRRDAASRRGERGPATGQQRIGEHALDARLEVEVLLEVGVLADHVARAAGQLLPALLLGLPEVNGAPAVALLVGDPELEP